MNDSLKPHHHHLIHGEIIFKHKDHEQIHSTRVNGVLVDLDKDIPLRLLGKAQQILQLNFHQRMQDESIQVLDVILADFSYMGHMTQEEFQASPDGTTLQQKQVTPEIAAVQDLDKVIQEANATKE